MTSDKTEVTQPADPDPSAEADTEGHSLLNGELAQTINRDRAREAEKIALDSARAREARPKHEGGFLKRFGRR